MSDQDQDPNAARTISIATATHAALEILRRADYAVPLTESPTRGLAMIQLMLISLVWQGFPKHEHQAIAEGLLTAVLYEREVGAANVTEEDLIKRLENVFRMSGADQRRTM